MAKASVGRQPHDSGETPDTISPPTARDRDAHGMLTLLRDVSMAPGWWSTVDDEAALAQ